MTPLVRTAAFLGSGLALTLFAPPQGKASSPAKSQPVKSASAMRDEVQRFLQHYLQVLERGDEQAMVTLFVDDPRFAWFTDGVKVYESPAAVVAGRKRYAGIRFQTRFTDTEIVPLAAALVSVRTQFRTELKIPDAPDHAFGGAVTMLLQKNATTAAWQVLLGHTSTPGEPRRQQGSPAQKSQPAQKGERGGKD